MDRTLWPGIGAGTVSDRIIAFLPLLGEDLSRAQWCLGEQSLLERALAVLGAVDAVSRIFAETDKPPLSPLPVDWIMPEEMRRLIGRPMAESGLMTLDPLRPWFSPEPLQRAVEQFFAQAAPRTKVVSVARVPNHFDPRKVLTQTGNGCLSYYDSEGAWILRRQDLDADPIYSETGALSIVDPMNKRGGPPLAVVGEETRMRIERESHLIIAEAMIDQ